MQATIFTGAGASKPLDYSTTTEFFPSDNAFPKPNYLNFFNHIKEHLGVSGVVDVEKVLEVLQPAEENLKTLSGKFIAKKLTDNWGNLIPSFTEYIRGRCFDLYGFYPNEDKVNELYNPLLDIVRWKEQKISLFTVNYDPVTDAIMEIAEQMKIPSYDGFKPRGRWDPSGYNDIKKGFNIYRLHGSMSWIKQGAHVINTRDYSRRSGNTKHLIIYPGYKGNPENEEEEVFYYPHNALRTQLEKTDLLIVIGFSFRDNHINSILNNAFKKNPGLKLIVINDKLPQGLSKLETYNENSVVHIKDKFGNNSAIENLRVVADNIEANISLSK
jgi:hypothetical protein